VINIAVVMMGNRSNTMLRYDARVKAMEVDEKPTEEYRYIILIM
jgi:hypothetical protein